MSEQLKPDEIARRWWRALQPYRDDGTPSPTGDRAALARLRRASQVLDAYGEEAVLELYGKLRFAPSQVERHLPWVAAAASVLATVSPDRVAARNSRPVPFCRALGPSRLDYDKNRNAEGLKRFESAALKPKRLQRLLQSNENEPDELVRQLRRAVALLPRSNPASSDSRQHGIDVGALAKAILSWPDRERGDAVRTRWAYDYLAAGDASPSPDDEPAAVPDAV